MNKAKAVIAFHNMLSMQVKNVSDGMEVQETRPGKTTSLFRFFTEDPAVRYVIQTTVDVQPKKYMVDVIVLEETVVQDETTANMIDNKVFEVNELGVKDPNVKNISKYIRGAVKAINTNIEQVFAENETAADECTNSSEVVKTDSEEVE